MNFSNNGEYTIRDAPSFLKLVAVGDVIPSGRVEALFSSGNAKHVFGDTSSIFMENDLVLFNLEAPLCSNGVPIAKCGANFKAHPNVVKGLNSINFGIAALANNHIMDHGEDGLKSTLECLDKAGILRHGAGMSWQDARKPLIVDAKGVATAFLNFAEGEFSKISRSTGGAARLDPLANKIDIETAKKDSDLVIVSVHAGKEFQHFPSPRIQDLYRDFISYGADLVIGHHPHIPQGVEHYRKGLIAYSFGDFMFEYGQDPGTCITLALEIGLDKSGVTAVKMHPIRKRPDTKMELLTGVEKQTFINHMNRISSPLTSRKELEKLYEQGIIRHFDSFYSNNLKKHINNINASDSRRQTAGEFLYNMFDCPSHRYALKTVFKLIYQGQYEVDDTTQEYLKELYACLESLGRQDSLEPWKKPESFLQKLRKRIQRRLSPLETL